MDTGALGNGRLAHNRRISVNADYTIEAGLSRYVSVSDAIHFWYFRIPDMNSVNSTTWTIPRDTTQPNNGYTLLTPVDSLTPVTTIATNYNSLNQKNVGNTVLGIFTVTPRVKLSAGWRFNSRNIVEGEEDNLTWHQNWLLLGVVVQPSPIFRLNINYDGMRTRWESGSTPDNLAPSDTYTRVMPNHANHLRMRARVVPAKWSTSLSLAIPTWPETTILWSTTTSPDRKCWLIWESSRKPIQKRNRRGRLLPFLSFFSVQVRRAMLG